MKRYFISFLVLSFLSSFAFAVETSTECEMMREQNERSNPKAGMENVKSKPKQSKGSSGQ